MENVVPSVLPRTDSVWVRAPHAVEGGSLITTFPSASVVPRSTCSHCGNALFVLSQYVDALPSLAFDGGKPPTEPLAVAVLLSATFVDESTACPESEIVVGLFTALLVIVTEPVRPPAAVGLNVTVTVQLAPTARLVPQLFVCAKSPLAAIELIDAA